MEDVEPEKMLERLSKTCLSVFRWRNLFSGYWKVYNNPGRAKMIFWAYDKAKTSAVNEYLIGKSIRDIAYVAAC